MANLSDLVTFGKAADYIEFAWVCAPNATAQTVSVDTVTTLTIDTEVQDTGDLVIAPGTGGLPANTFELPAGIYYYEAFTRFTAGNLATPFIFSLYNVSDSAYVARSNYGTVPASVSSRNCCPTISGQFKITSSKRFRLQLLVDGQSVTIASSDSGTQSSVTTADADQRTTIKLWKLK